MGLGMDENKTVPGVQKQPPHGQDTSAISCFQSLFDPQGPDPREGHLKS